MGRNPLAEATKARLEKFGGLEKSREEGGVWGRNNRRWCQSKPYEIVGFTLRLKYMASLQKIQILNELGQIRFDATDRTNPRMQSNKYLI